MEEKMRKSIYDSFATAGGCAIGFLFGAVDGLFYALVAFAVLDYLTGLINAVIKRKLSSRVGFDGIFKKIMLFVIVAVANIIDVQVLGGEHAVLRTAVITFLLANEGLSILENACSIGVPVPKKLRAVFEQLKDKSDKCEREENDNE
jgi:toxin secretion/phage lysis holin